MARGKKNNKIKKKSEVENKTSIKTSSIKNDIIVLLSFTFCVFLFISNFGLCGPVGNVINGALFGVFGLLNYLLPVILFVITIFILANKNNKKVIFRIVYICFMLLFLLIFEAICFNGSSFISGKTAFNIGYIKKSGAGFIGTVIANFLISGIGMFGTVLVDVLGVLVFTILLLNRSLISIVKNNIKKGHDNRAIEKHVEDKQDNISEEIIQEEDSSLSRRSKKVRGVSFNTKIEPQKASTEDMQEVFADENNKYYENSSYQYQQSNETISRSPIKDKIEKKATRKENTRSMVENENEILNRTDDIIGKTNAFESQAGNDYVFPPINLLKQGMRRMVNQDKYINEMKSKLENTLLDFGVDVVVSDAICGPTVTRYEITPKQGVKVSKIVALADDIKLNLAASDIRIEAPIPGKAAVGIEVPNKESSTVMLRDILETKEFASINTKIPFPAGLDIGGNIILTDIAKMPHVLIAGATGSGKSVCINTIILSILYKARPDEVKLIMIDPKVVELSVYNGIPHLLIPVVTDPKKAAGALHWAVNEMTNRYNAFAEEHVRDIKAYNELMIERGKEDPESLKKKMPQIVIIVDELADLMMVASNEVEEAICRLAQLARACGIHLVLATQRPSVNVITGLIKANMPSRVAFAVSSGVDSRTILDSVGAEKLLGKGDMLFYPQGLPKPQRVQGAFVSDGEVSAVCEFLKERYKPDEVEIQEKQQTINSFTLSDSVLQPGLGATTDDGRDVYFAEAGRFIIEKERASIGLLQRQYKIGFNRAARIMDQLEEAGVVGPEEGTKPRKILMSIVEFNEMIENSL